MKLIRLVNEFPFTTVVIFPLSISTDNSVFNGIIELEHALINRQTSLPILLILLRVEC